MTRSMGYLSRTVVALAAIAAFAVSSTVLAQSGTDIKPYTGPPIFLDEPESPPPASFVEKRIDTEKYENGKIRHEREIARYSDNRFVADGFYREFYPNGQKFSEGQYKNGKQVGKWTFWHENGKVARTVNYVDGQPDGSWEVHNAEGAVVAKRSYKAGKRDGTWVIFDKEGKQPLREEVYSDGKPNGVWKVWFADGKQKTEISIKDGERDGPAIEWDEKGNKRAELTYVAGKVHGTATAWAADGRKVVQQYDHGKLVKESN